MYGIYALVNLFSPKSLARCTRSFVLRKQISVCVNTIRQHFPLRNRCILAMVSNLQAHKQGRDILLAYRMMWGRQSKKRIRNDVTTTPCILQEQQIL